MDEDLAQYGSTQDYDAQRSDTDRPQPVPNRAAAGAESVGNRTPKNAGLASDTAAFQDFGSERAKNAKGRENPQFWPVLTAFPVVPRLQATPATSAA